MAESDPPPSLAALARSLRLLRKKAAQASFEVFCQLYLAPHFSVAPSSMHQEIAALLVEATTERGARIAVAAPRGYAKTTLVCLAYVLWCLVRASEPFIVLISNTSDQAVQLLANIKKELEENPLLLEDFPEVAEPPGRKPSPKRWREREILTRNGLRVTVLGAGQKLRGRKHGKDRPSLILLDDVEAEPEAHSADLREKRQEWFEKAVLKAGDTGLTNVFVVGTLLHYDSLLARLVGIGNLSPRPGWTTRRYQAVLSWAEDEDAWECWENIYTLREEFEGRTGPEAARWFYTVLEKEMLAGAQVLWPERESYLQLMEMRLTDGRASFDSEKQNDPIAAADCLFNPESFIYWDDHYRSEEEMISAFGREVEFIGACDPSLGKEGRHADYTGILTLLRHKDSERLYVLDAILEKCKPSQVLKIISDLNSRRRYRSFAIEVNQFQELLADQLDVYCARHGYPIRLKKIHHTGDKMGRIQGLEPLIKSGRILFSRRHRILLEQLRQFPRAAHDDGPDALEMAVEVSRPDPVPRIIFLD